MTARQDTDTALGNERTSADQAAQAAKQDLDAANATIAQQQATIIDLKGQLDAAKPPPTPTPTTTQTGSSLGGNLGGATHMDVSRVYYQTSMPAKWTDSQPLQRSAELGVKTVVLSWKTTDAAAVSRFLATKPAGVKAYGCYHHEPEDDYGDTVKYKQVWQTMGKACRDNGVVPTLILMKYTLQKNSGRNWLDWYPEGSVDCLGWDAYNAGAKKNPPIYSPPDNLLQPVVDIAKQTGLPWGLGETGSGIIGVAKDRALWAKQMRDWSTANGAAWLCWWDQQAFSDTGQNFSLDAATAATWLG